MSTIREIADCGLDREVFLLYGNAGLDDAIFHEEITATARGCDRIHYFPVIEATDTDFAGHCGYITAGIIREAISSATPKNPGKSAMRFGRASM